MIAEFQGEYRWLSNFWIAPYVVGPYTLQSVEHGFQAAKAYNKYDAYLIATASTPGQAKKLGRTVKVREDWDEIRIKVMYNHVTEKFRQNKDLAQKLLDTGDQELIEGNYWGDRFWGVCKGEGDNWLGRILMQVRKEIRTKGIEVYCEV